MLSAIVLALAACSLVAAEDTFTPDELDDMGMHELAQKARELRGGEKKKKPPAVDLKGCEHCKKVVTRMEEELSDMDFRGYPEVNAYLGEVCDDMEGFYKKDVVDWCRAEIQDNKQHRLTISGLLQMAGNLQEAVCNIAVKACPKAEVLVSADVDVMRDEEKEVSSFARECDNDGVRLCPHVLANPAIADRWARYVFDLHSLSSILCPAYVADVTLPTPSPPLLSSHAPLLSHSSPLTLLSSHAPLLSPRAPLLSHPFSFTPAPPTPVSCPLSHPPLFLTLLHAPPLTRHAQRRDLFTRKVECISGHEQVGRNASYGGERERERERAERGQREGSG
jgi:hypothetical protein